MPGKRKRSWTGSRKGGRKRSKGAAGAGKYGKSAQGYSFRGRPNGRTTLAYMDRYSNQPDAIRIKVKTYLTFTVTSSTGAFSVDTIKMSSLFQPFFGIGSSTHQNPTINNLVTLYQRYRVESAYLSAAFTPLSSAQPPGPVWVALGIWDNSYHSTSLTSANQFVEGKHTKFGYVPTYQGFTGKPTVLKLGGPIAQFMGFSPMEYSTSSSTFGAYNGSTLGDPAQWLDIFLAAQTNDAATTATVSVDAVLTQYVVMFSRQLYS